MLALDSLVIDLIFKANADLKPEELIQSLGGDEVVRERKVLDPDMQDPRFELELSPSMPFRRQGERRLMIIDDSVAPMRKDPRTEAVIPIDLRPEKERLIAACAGVAGAAGPAQRARLVGRRGPGRPRRARPARRVPHPVGARFRRST